METNGEKFNAELFLQDLKEKGEAAKKEMLQKSERLKQEIIDAWDQHSSVFFWQQCFKFVPLDVIRRTYRNVLELQNTGYPVKSPPGLFVSTLKRMGYFPFKKAGEHEPA